MLLKANQKTHNHAPKWARKTKQKQNNLTQNKKNKPTPTRKDKLKNPNKT